LNTDYQCVQGFLFFNCGSIVEVLIPNDPLLLIFRVV
jgi:hypothetical protein